jgi:hypothetical protein
MNCNVIIVISESNKATVLFRHFSGWTWVIFFYCLVCEAIATAATPGLLYQPRVIVKMIVEKQMECRLSGKTEILGENLPQRHFFELG